jgi:Leucine-rich repeat (LRR) protein
MRPLLPSLFARLRGLSWGERGYALTVLFAVLVFGNGGMNGWRAGTYERMHQRIAQAGAKSTRSITVLADPEEAYFSAILGDFSAVALNGVIGRGSDCRVDAALLRDLRNYPEVTTLSLSQVPLQFDDYQQIYKLENLTSLNLGFNKLTDDDLAGIENLESLEHLNLQFTSLTDVSLGRLEKLRGLSTIDISGTDITLEGAERLRLAYRKIQGAKSTQVIHRPALSPKFRAAVTRLLPTKSYARNQGASGNEIRLQLRGDAWKGYEQDIPLIVELQDIEAVDMVRMPLSPQLLEALVHLPKFQSLGIRELPGQGQDLSRLAGCRSLRSLRLDGMLLDEGFLASLVKLESLESLGIYNCQFTPGACRAIADISSVRSLRLRSLDVSPADVTELLSELESSAQLRLLDLVAMPIDNESVPRLAHLTQLVSLGLRAVEIDDHAVPELCKFTHLRQLDISGTRISSRGRGKPVDGATQLDGMAQLEAALFPANTRVVHPASKKFFHPLNLENLEAQAKDHASAAVTAQATSAATRNATSNKPPAD